MAFWKRNRVKPVTTRRTPAQQRQTIVDQLKRSGAKDSEITQALRKWEKDRTAMGFKSK
jgi:hypothetical protein